MLLINSSGCHLLMCIIFWAIHVLVGVSGQAAELVITSPSQPLYYSGDMLTVDCEGTGATEATGIALTVTDTGGENVLATGCSFGASGWAAINDEDLALADKFSADCSDVERDDMIMTSVSGSIETSMSRYQMQCAVTVGRTTTKSTVTTLPDEIRVEPSDLSQVISYSGEFPVSGTSFTVECTSTSAVPTSRYTYEILSSGMTEVIATSVTGPVTAEVKSRYNKQGFTVRCMDTVHEMRPEALTMKSSDTIRPCYIEENGIEKDLSLNPSVKHTVTCDVSAYPSDTLTYQWYRNGTLLTDTGKSISISSMSNMASEPLICKASVGCYNLNVTWSIVWDVAVPTPTPGDGGTRATQKSMTPVYIAVPIVVVVVIVIIVALVIYCKKKKAIHSRRRAGSSDNNEQHPMTGQDSEKGPDAPKQDLRKEDDPVIYAELDHSTNKVTKPARPRDDQVVYTQIDPKKTSNMQLYDNHR